jgi:LysM repeat protein
MLPRRLQELSLTVGVATVLGCAGAAVPPHPAPSPAQVRRPPLAAPAWTIYVVQPGDSLSRIAACSGTSAVDLAQINHLANPDFVLIGARLRVPGRSGCGAPPTPRDRAAQLLAAANARLEAADFERALSLAESCARPIEPGPPEPQGNGIRARCHVVAGMAAAGLDRRERAIGEFRQAFALDPTLELAEDTTSPRILDLVSAARPAPSR